jgi:superfamily II DNA or RNA helicase
MLFSPGLKVAARGLEWDVIEADPPPPDTGPSQSPAQQRLRLVCTSQDLAGLEWDILHPLESVTLLQTDPDPRNQGTLDAWRRYHTAWLLDQIPSPITPLGRLTAEPYQRVPLNRAMGMVRPRLLLADDVGLGKTIQAGLIAAELLIRRRAHRILIVSPPGPLLRQWDQEMRHRFGLRFTTLADAAALQSARRRLEFGGNPFDATALCLTSIDFVKSDHVLTELERTHWDLVIIDEAHHCAPLDSRRYLLAKVLAGLSDGLLLLTATPHDGHDPHFAALMTLLDPSLTDGAGRLIGTAYRRHVIRRLKSHIADPRTGLPLFPPRRVTPIRVQIASDRVRTFHKSLTDFVLPRLKAPRDTKHLTDALAFVSLLKRSLSTLAACVATLRVIAARHGAPETAAERRDRQAALRKWRRRVARYGVLAAAEEDGAALLEAEEMAASLPTADALAALIAAGEAALKDDPKLQTLQQEIRLIRLEEPDANILVYTEYAESQRAALSALQPIGTPILTISGADSEADRTHAAERFAEETTLILISTDALAEGLNLHQACHHLIHLDLPYNPNRLEQRNGRIDRYGQRHAPDIRYCYLADTFEERLLLKLIDKYESARARLDLMPNTLAVPEGTQGLKEPLFADTPDLFANLPRPVHSLDLIGEDTATPAFRDLLKEIDHAFKSFEDMAVRHGWLSGTPPDAPQDTQTTDIDLPAFVAAALPDNRVPAAWSGDLAGLPGYDGTTNTIRLTNDPDRLRDETGQPLLYPGRTHPLTRRVIAQARADRSGQVAAVTGPLSLLATYTAETTDHRFRTILGVLRHPNGRTEPVADILALSKTTPTTADWDQDFAPWTDLPALDDAAARIATEALAQHSSRQAEHTAREDAAVAAWLTRRANDLCGPAKPANDLFASTTVIEPASAEARLRACAADPDEPPGRRQEASAILATLDARKRTHPPQLRLRPLGLLLRSPAA